VETQFPFTEKYSVAITTAIRLTFFKDLVAACSVNRAKYVITILQLNAGLLYGEGCICDSHRAL